MKLTDTRTGQVCRDNLHRRIVILHGGVIYQRPHTGAPITETTLTRIPYGARRTEQRYGLLVAYDVTETDAQALSSDATYRDRLVHAAKTTGKAQTDQGVDVTLVSPSTLTGPWSQTAYEHARRRYNRRECSYERHDTAASTRRAALEARDRRRLAERNAGIDTLRARLAASGYDRGERPTEWSLTEPRVTIEYATLAALLDAARDTKDNT